MAMATTSTAMKVLQPLPPSNGLPLTNNIKVPAFRRAKSTNSIPSVPRTRMLKGAAAERSKHQASRSPGVSANNGTTETALAEGSTRQAARSPGGTASNGTAETALANGLRKLNLKSASKVSRTRRTSAKRKVNGSAGGSSGLKNLQDVAKLIQDKQAKNIVVMVGAGISTPSGIPDFRTPGTGLYSNLQQYRIPQPQDIFDIDYFERSPKPFYVLAKELFPSGRYRPNYVHYFLRLLYEKGLLLRVYTQNIDGLERMAGIPSHKLVEAHGSFLTASCIRCHSPFPQTRVKEAVFGDKVPRCADRYCLGLVKPDIVFFGEDLPRRFYYYLKDFPQADLLLVMGTSLAVEPFAGIVDSTRFAVPRVLFNREVVGPFQRKKRVNDLAEKGDILERVRAFVNVLGWKNDLEKLIGIETTLLQETLQAEANALSTKEIESKSPVVSNNSAKPVISLPRRISFPSTTPKAPLNLNAATYSSVQPTLNNQFSNRAKTIPEVHSLPNTPLLNRPKDHAQSFSSNAQNGRRPFQTGIPGQGGVTAQRQILPNLKFVHTGRLGGSTNSDAAWRNACNNYFSGESDDDDDESSEESSDDDE